MIGRWLDALKKAAFYHFTILIMNRKGNNSKLQTSSYQQQQYFQGHNNPRVSKGQNYSASDPHIMITPPVLNIMVMYQFQRLENTKWELVQY